jgi:hypothetical protein
MQTVKVADGAPIFQWYHCFGFGPFSHRKNKPSETAVSMLSGPEPLPPHGALAGPAHWADPANGGKVGRLQTTQSRPLQRALATCQRTATPFPAVQCSALQCSAVTLLIANSAANALAAGGPHVKRQNGKIGRFNNLTTQNEILYFFRRNPQLIISDVIISDIIRRYPQLMI